MLSFKPSILALVFALPFTLLSGCATGPLATDESSGPQTSGGLIQGKTFGGQQPIVGLHVYLYAAATTAYGDPSISLLRSVAGKTTADANGNYYATTDSGGNFQLAGEYTCTPGTQVYLYGVGGNAGAGNNSAAALMDALGNCPASGSLASQVPNLYVDEVSTVLTAYALAGFATDATHIGSSGTALAKTGIANAFTSVPNLMSLSTGLAYDTTPAGNGTVPHAKIDTLANIIASCLNSNGPTSPACTLLLANSTSDGTSTGVKATDVATAAINIAHHPGTPSTAATLFPLQVPASPFTPQLTAAPNDFTLAISYTGGGMATTPHLAVDAAGNIWTTPDNTSIVTKLSPLGAPLSGTGGFTGTGTTGSKNIAMDVNGNAVVLGLSSALTAIVATVPNTGTGATSSQFLAQSKITGTIVDASQNLFFINSTNNALTSVAEGSILPTAHLGGGITAGNNDTAQDASGNIWVTNSNNSLSKFTSAGVAITGTAGYTGGGLSTPVAIAIDAYGDAIIANSATNSLSGFTSAGVALTGTGGQTGGGLSKPSDLAEDGSNNVWVSNATGNSITAFNGATGAAISGNTAYVASSLSSPCAIAIDGSGNVWVGNAGNANLTEFLGAAAPVVTPLSVAVKNKTVATRP